MQKLHMLDSIVFFLSADTRPSMEIVILFLLVIFNKKLKMLKLFLFNYVYNMVFDLFSLPLLTQMS